MEKNTELTQWIDQTTGGDSWRDVAKKLGTTHSTIQRRLFRGEADAIIELAREYDVNPLPGLIAAGTITRLDIMAIAGTYAVDDLDDVELARIMVQRLEQRERSNGLHVVSDPHDSLDDDGTVKDFDWSESYAADSSPDETEERLKRGEDPID